MVQKRKSTFIKKVKDITIGGSLGLILLGGGAMVQNCGKKEETVIEYTKGVHTYVKETEKGVFKITEEKATDSWDARAVVTYLDGRVDTLNEAQIKELIHSEVDTSANAIASAPANAKDSTNSRSTYRHHSFMPGLGMLFWYGAMGNLFGRRGGVVNPNFYATPDAYNRSRQTTTQLHNSRVTRPVGSSKGFFRSTGSSSFRG